MQASSRLLAAAAASALSTSASAATSLIDNGDFEQGLQNFGTHYSYLPTAANPQTLTVDDNPKALQPYWPSFGDHTTGQGQMLIVNGGQDAGVLVWRPDQTNIPVIAGATYNFSAWLAGLSDDSPARLRFTINGLQVGDVFTVGGIDDGWRQFHIAWNAGAATTAAIGIFNLNTEVEGNDFALDDLSFSLAAPIAVPEPAAWATMLLGFGAAGAFLRRRRRSEAAAAGGA